MLSLISAAGRADLSGYSLPDLNPLHKELSRLSAASLPSDYLCVNIKLDNGFDFVLSHNIDNLEAVRCYFCQKDCLNEMCLRFARMLDSLIDDGDEGSTLKTVAVLFTSIKEKLLSINQPSPTSQAPVNESQIAIQDSRCAAFSEMNHAVEFSQKASCKDKMAYKEMGSLREGNLSDFEVVSNYSRGCASLYNSPVMSPNCDVPGTSKKKPAKSKFNEYAKDVKVKSFHREWPLLQKSNTLNSNFVRKVPADDSSPASNENPISPSNMSPVNKEKRPSDAYYQDNSPSIISLITRDDKKVIKDRVATYELLMKSAWYLKRYLRNLTLKKQEILSLIESFYYDDKDLLEMISDHKVEHNNPKTLHKIQHFLELQNRAFFRSPRKINYNFKQTLEFLGYFEIVAKDFTSLLRTAYDKLDHRVYEVWEAFCKSKNLIDFGSKLGEVASIIVEEKKAAIRRVAYHNYRIDRPN